MANFKQNPYTKTNIHPNFHQTMGWVENRLQY